MANLHIIISEDDFLVGETARKLLAGVEGLEVIDSNLSTNAEQQLRDIAAADESYSTPPFLEPTKATWWKNVNFLPQRGANCCSEEVKASLERFARKIASAALPDNQVFILSGAKLLNTSTFAKTLKNVAAIKEFSEVKPWERARAAAATAESFAKDEGFSFARGAADRFVSIVGFDTRTLMSEVKKLRDYIGKDGATAEISDVDAIASRDLSAEPEIWSITDALGERSVSKLWDALVKFEDDSGFPIVVTSVAEKFFRTQIELNDACAGGRREEAVAGMSPYAAKKNLAFAANWTLPELRAARARLIALRERAVSSSSGVGVLVTTELLRICAPRKGSAR